MNVRFAGNTEIYQIQVTIPGTGLIQLHPPFPDADLTAGFEVLTPKGTVFGKYLDYTTIYREVEDGSVILSNDGRVYVPSVEPEPVEPYVPTLEEIKAAKKEEVGVACNAIIFAGVDVVLTDGSVEHFSLEENEKKHDQINLFGKQYQLAAGAERVEYHADGKPCRYYSLVDMQTIITIAMFHVSYHTTYCNSLNMWIAGAETVEEVNSIYYGADIPEKYQSGVLNDYLAQIAAQAGEVVENEAVS